MSTLTADHIKELSKPFDEKTLGVKVQSFTKDRSRASLVCYLQHTDVYIRIEAVDPAWKSEILSVDWVNDVCFTRMRLTILGVSRENVGEGNDPKSAASDAIKRCAMLFGVGRYLYDAETVWVEYNEQRDRFRTWTLADYNGALKRGQAQLPTAPPAAQGPAPTQPATNSAPRTAGFGSAPAATKMTRMQLGSEIYKVAGIIKLGDKELADWAFEVFKKKPDVLTDDELERFLKMLQMEQGRMGASHVQ